MKAVKDALHDGFGVAPARVRADRPTSRSSTTRPARCAARSRRSAWTCIPACKLNRERLQETADFLRDFLGRLECIAGTNGAGCPADLATGAGTGFRLVTDHIPEFAKRGMCARDPKRALADGVNMRDAAQAAERRCVQALFAGGDAALCAPLAAVPHAE